MSIDQPEYKNYDVQYSLRLPQDLADEITARAEREGVKPSTWIRNNLVRLIQNKDEEKGESIKSAVMYLLTSDSDVQKQIQQIAGEVRKKGEKSKVEIALTEYTALNEQSEILEKNIQRLDVDTVDLYKKLDSLKNELNLLHKKIDVVNSTFEKDDDKELQFILAEYEKKCMYKQEETSKIEFLLKKKRDETINQKMLLTEINGRKREILSKYNMELSRPEE